MLPLLMLLLACRPATESSPRERPFDFEPFDGLDSVPDAHHDRLCAEAADPEGAPDKVFIDCRTEGANLAPSTPDPVDDLVVWAYNLERGFELQAQIALAQDGILPFPDVVLVSEADRGCNRTDGANIPWEFAEALGMNYVFAVEFVELARPEPMGFDDDHCEHGNFIASRFPIGNVRAFRHETTRSWYDEGERRLGGRIGLTAAIEVGDRYATFYEVHFESSPADVDIQVEQARETAGFAAEHPGVVVVGGDTNAPFYGIDLLTNGDADLTIEAFEDQGFTDAHLTIEPADRGTIDAGFIIDLILTRGTEVQDAQICAEADCGGLSDHLPIWAVISLE